MDALSSCGLPPSTVGDADSRQISDDEREFATLKQISGKIARTIAKYNTDHNLVAFSQRVQKISNYYSTSMSGHAAHSNGFHAPSDKTERKIALSTEIKDMVKVFTDAVKETEDTAIGAFQAFQYDVAKSGFTVLQQALDFEKGSERYFVIQGYLLTTHIRQESIGDAIALLLELETSPVPRDNERLGAWLSGMRAALGSYIAAKTKEIEGRIKQLRDEIYQRATDITTILTQDRQSKNTNPKQPLYSLKPITAVLERVKGELEKISAMAKAFVTFSIDLRVPWKSSVKEAQDEHAACDAFLKSALALLDELYQCSGDAEKNGVLCKWIETNIAEYRKQAVSAIHAWALSLLSKLFTSSALTSQDLQESVKLGRRRAASLAPHFSAFLSDVFFAFDSDGLESALLMLGIISKKVVSDFCTTDCIASIQPTFLLSSIRRGTVAMASRFVTIQKKSDLPQIVFPQQIQPNIVRIFKALLMAFKANTFATLQEFSTEEKVSLFEIGCDLLEMPDSIIQLSIESVNTPEFQRSLDALQWLRLVQATRIPFKYNFLEVRFRDLVKADFLKWIALYNPKRVTVDPKNHYRLFQVVIDRAIALCKQPRTFSEEEVNQIFIFVAERYNEVVGHDLDRAKRNMLLAKFIQFSALCVSLIEDSDLAPQHGVLATITTLDTKYFEEIRDLLKQKRVRAWLEKMIYPTLLELTVHDGLDEETLDHFSHSSSLTMLSVAGLVRIGEWQWDRLGQYFPDLSSLELDGGQVALAELDRLSLTSLSLANVGTMLDFSACTRLQGGLQVLRLSHVDVAKNSLSWIVGSKKLTSFQLENPAAPIGSLASEELPHRKPALQKFDLKNVFMNAHFALIQVLNRLSDQEFTQAIDSPNLGKWEAFIAKFEQHELNAYLMLLFDCDEKTLKELPEDWINAFDRLEEAKIRGTFRTFIARQVKQFLTVQEQKAMLRLLGSQDADGSFEERVQVYTTEEIVQTLEEEMHDKELIVSLPKLLATQSEVTSISIQTGTETSLVKMLSSAASLTELAIPYSSEENISLLAQFPHLERVTFFSDDPAVAGILEGSDLRKLCPALRECVLQNAAKATKLIEL